MLVALKRLAASRKAILVFVGAAFTLAVHFVPQLDPLKGDALTFVDAGIGLLVAAIAAEDAAEKLGPGDGAAG